MVSTNDRHELNILEAFGEDEGLYKCVVSNPAGKTSSSAHLKIIRKKIKENKMKFLNFFKIRFDRSASVC